MSKSAKTSERSATSQRAAAHGNAAQQTLHAAGPDSGIHESPRMAAQRRRAMVSFGEAAQRMEDEELLQGKFDTVQRAEEEELLQGKFDPTQRVEEEEPLQGKFDTAQRVEEEEPLQGKFDTAQRMEDEEPLQGKFDTAQRVEEEEPLQGNFDTGQRAEEEELLQGKFDAAQRVEEEDPLQGKFDTAQRMEEEEPLQGKFDTAQRMEEEEPLQGKFDTAQRMEEEEPLQAKETGAPANKTGMPDDLKAGIESMSGMDLSGVKVHRNSGKAADLQAHAYAQGNDIHVAPGQEKHLPHEAWHVVQQRQGRVKPTMQLQGVAVNDDIGLEHEADVMGAKALQMTSADPAIAQRVAASGSGSVLQRDIDIPALSKKIQASRQEATRLAKAAKTPSDKDNIELVWTKLSVLSGLIAQTVDDQDAVKEAMKSFSEWTKGDGYDPWTTFEAAKAANKPEEVAEATTAAPAAVTYSAECDAVFADMQAQYSAWNGKKKSRGAWWGSPGPGQTTGATAVPHTVVQELRSRVHKTRWQFASSDSGGVSFKQTRGGIAFIYHMLPP